MTKKGYALERQENCFIVKEIRMCFDYDTQLSYVEEEYHSQISVFVGIGKRDCLKMIKAWLSFFEDEEMLAQAELDIDELFRQQKMLPIQVTVGSDDKDMN